MTNSSDQVLSEINQNLNSFKDFIRDELNQVKIELVEVNAELKNISNNLSNRVDRLEQVQAAHENHLIIAKDDIHGLANKLIEVKNAPEEISKLRHRVSNAEQLIAIAQEQIKAIEDVKTTSQHNSELLGNQQAIYKFIASKPVWAFLVVAIGAIAFKYGLVTV